MATNLEVFCAGTPHYICAVVEGPDVGPYEAMQEALRLEKLTGCVGCWMIRDNRFQPAREYPAFLSAVA